MTTKKLFPKQARWAEELARFDFEIEYKQYFTFNLLYIYNIYKKSYRIYCCSLIRKTGVKA